MMEYAVVHARVVKTEIKFGRRRMLHVYIEDKSGMMMLRFFNFNKYQVEKLKEEKWIRAFGEVRRFSHLPEMIHPEYQLVDDEFECPVEEHLTPIYHSTQGLSQTRLRQLVMKAIELCNDDLQALEWMTPEQLSELAMMPIHEAIYFLHQPPPDVPLQRLEEGQHPAIKRLAFDELIAQRLSMQFARQSRTSLKAAKMNQPDNLISSFIAALPFKLTQAQQRVWEDIICDMEKPEPMLRLVQGDVGSGKTVVAALAALKAIANGYQAAFMAPTDILSEQHAVNLERWLSPLGIQVHRLSGKMTAKAKRETLKALSEGSCQLAVGTHALFQEQVQFSKLGLVIIDEQHRFGVEQRLLLHKKGQQDEQVPHQLLMTATPIPRTLSMTHLAHLDCSVIDELPPGRSPVITAVMSQERREPVIERLTAAISEGRQAYWVCTLIEESEKLQCIAATDTAAILQEKLSKARVGLVHGRMKAKEKDEVMMRFKAGDIDLLVATTVIEVGVDVPNASLMIIENAERLGLSQLHQLRGRVGRGQNQSHCLLLYQSPLSHQGNERLKIMRASNDGFVIAEKDMELRGAGEILGVRQTGYRQFKIADLSRDQQLLLLLPAISKKLIDENQPLAQQLTQRWLGDFEHFLQG